MGRDRRLRRPLFLPLTLMLAGCASPLLEYDLEGGAAALLPLGAASIQDGRPRFRQVFCGVLARDGLIGKGGSECEHYLLRLGDEDIDRQPAGPLPAHATRLRVMIVPGALGECFGADALPYLKAVERLRESGYRIDYLRVDGRSGSANNARQIAARLHGLRLEPGEELVLFGYSKGASDILRFLSEHPETARKVTTVVSVAGSINGSPLADRYAGLYDFFIGEFPFDDCGVGDRRLLTGLQRASSMLELARHPPPAHVAYYSLGAFTEAARIARVMRLAGYPDLRRADPRNDGQTLYYDQVIPGATLLGYANADHWAVAIPMEEAMPFFAGNGATDTPYPRGALFEAILLYLGERSINAGSP